MAESNLLEEPQDFSPVLGGPLYQLLRRAILRESNWTLISPDILYRGEGLLSFKLQIFGL
jgi:hypothetical protein